jgi:hypothetical protein
MWRVIIAFLLVGCAGIGATDDMVVVPARHDLYDVATLQKITDATAPVHIYIEGDGHAFDYRGQPTKNPTPRSRFMRRMYAADDAPNVAYVARPCQFVMDEKCTTTDWTSGRFSRAMVDSVASAIKNIVGNRPVILVGYSGGAMISGLVIEKHPELNVKKWITIAGVLNHADWTTYFNDTPLTHSLNLDTLPQLPATHYIVENDSVVPNILSKQWVGESDIKIIKNARHDRIPIIKLDFND